SANCPSPPDHKPSPKKPSMPPNTKSQNSSDCGSDWHCNLGLKNKIDDALARGDQQRRMALAGMNCYSAACEDQAPDSASWVDNGDGTYSKTNGYDLITYTDTNRVQQIAKDKAAAA